MERITFGRSGLRTSRIAIGSSYGVGGDDLVRAYERGVNFFFWGLRRTDPFAAGVKAVLARAPREDVVVAVQTYSRMACLVRPSVDRARKGLGVDRIDLLVLGWWNDVPPARILDAARNVAASGAVKHVMVSCHHRPSFERMAVDPVFDGIMVRYSAAHPGAEREVFPHLGDERARRPGVLAFTATRWGTLLDPSLTPAGERTPRAGDCYRFVLSNPNVDVSLTGPKNGAELDEAIAAAEAGPMSADEVAWMRRVGDAVHAVPKGGSPVIKLLDKASNAFSGR